MTTRAGPDERPLRVLGIEGTAWAASAAVYDRGEAAPTFLESDAYEPESGGIHPREAAEHMHEAIPRVVEAAIAHAEDLAAGGAEGGDPGVGDIEVGDAEGEDADGAPIDAVAFSRGPGLGPCLRIVATAARAVAQRFDVPLVGVNHMVAHLEVGRHLSGFDDPVCLNASGANAHVLAYRNGRYRVLGETMDAGVGNAIDKFTRHVGWSHPGGPKVEKRARAGEYVDLPYVVKGMDFSFSGLSSAAQDAVDDGVPVEDVCRGLQETVFAMLTEVAERALALTGRDELVLGGGVGQNARLREMLAAMCDARGAAFHAPPATYLRDNAGMIAILGAHMAAARDTLTVADSRVDPDFRPDQVDVTWREAVEPSARSRLDTDDGQPVQGAEATVAVADGAVVKTREPRAYRHPTLDERLRRERTRREARLTSDARRVGVPTPVVRDVDVDAHAITFQFVGDADLGECLGSDHAVDRLDGDGPAEYLQAVGAHLARLHDAGLVHGDPTVRNVRVGTDRIFGIDFGLGYDSHDAEDHAMDLHVLAQSIEGTADDPDALVDAAIGAYRETSEAADAVMERLSAIEGRGRYQ